MMRHFLSLLDWHKEELETLLSRASVLKAESKEGRVPPSLQGKMLGLIFEKSSTRTRVSFETAMHKLGGSSIYLTQETSQLGRGETYEDTARVLSRYLDGLAVRTFEQTKLERMAKVSQIPIINALTDLLHPCQLLADLLTLIENDKPLASACVAWVGDGNNVANSWIEAAVIFGFTLKLACPRGFEPSGLLLQKIQKDRRENIRLETDPQTACKKADVISTDTWVSMGQEGKEEAKKRSAFQSCQVNAGLLKEAKPDAIVLHCLPAHRGEEITDEVMDGPQSRIWDQAENRLYVQMALLEKLIADS